MSRHAPLQYSAPNGSTERGLAGNQPSLADFKQLALLGEGAYSAVYKVLRLADNETYALKKVKLPSLSDKEKQNALNEIRLLASIQHENVIAYKEAFFDDKTRCLCIVQECADAGDLLQQINKCKQERSYLKENDIWRYLTGMCHGLKALHDLKILHRDMKCANIFLSSSPQGVIAKLGDFNVSKVAKRGLCMTQTGTPYYASPEVWRDMPYDAKSDMWSLGCILYEMVGLRPPFRAEDMEGLYRKVIRGQYPRIPSHYSQDLAEVIANLLQVHPRHRPSVDQLFQLPAMQRNAPGLKIQEERPSNLLNTIKLPKNAIDLSGCLPKPRYERPRLESIAAEVAETSTSTQVSPPARVSRRTAGGRNGKGQQTVGPLSEVSAGQLPPPPPPQRRLGERAPSQGHGLPPIANGGRGVAEGPDRQSRRPGLSQDGDALDAYILEHRDNPQASVMAAQVSPTINPRYNVPTPQVQVTATSGALGTPTVQGRSRGAAEPRRPMSIYARQQLVATSENAQATPAQAVVDDGKIQNETGSRRRRLLIPRLF